MLCPQHIRSSSLQSQSVHIPLVLMRNFDKQGDRKWVEVESFEVGMFATFVGAIEGVTGGVHRQCRNFNSLDFWGNGSDTRCCVEINSRQLTLS